jgi:hypothetical protein
MSSLKLGGSFPFLRSSVSAMKRSCRLAKGGEHNSKSTKPVLKRSVAALKERGGYVHEKAA